MKLKKNLVHITFRIGTSLDIARANYVLYCLIAKNVGSLRCIKGIEYLGNIQDNAKNRFSLEIHKAYALPAESKKEVASLGYVVSMLAKHKDSLNIQINKKYKKTLIKYCQKFITYNYKVNIIDNIVKSYKILRRQKKCDLEKFEKVRNEFIAHSKVTQTDLKGPQLTSIKKLISDGLEFTQMLYLVLWDGTLTIISEDEYLREGKSFLHVLGVQDIEYF